MKPEGDYGPWRPDGRLSARIPKDPRAKRSKPATWSAYLVGLSAGKEGVMPPPGASLQVLLRFEFVCSQRPATGRRAMHGAPSSEAHCSTGRDRFGATRWPGPRALRVPGTSRRPSACRSLSAQGQCGAGRTAGAETQHRWDPGKRGRRQGWHVASDGLFRMPLAFNVG